MRDTHTIGDRCTIVALSLERDAAAQSLFQYPLQRAIAGDEINWELLF
jgi:hypothetical protein